MYNGVSKINLSKIQGFESCGRTHVPGQLMKDGVKAEASAAAAGIELIGTILKHDAVDYSYLQLLLQRTELTNYQALKLKYVEIGNALIGLWDKFLKEWKSLADCQNELCRYLSLGAVIDKDLGGGQKTRVRWINVPLI
uniref:Uncharacterized protein n=1 Tax=Arundo donax TaxID=35708 RepID=A0A0A8ZH53_ARUDO